MALRTLSAQQTPSAAHVAPPEGEVLSREQVTSLAAQVRHLITFNGPDSGFSPETSFAAMSGPIIAPFFAEVDMRPPSVGGAPGGSVTYGPETYGGRTAFGVHWDGVDYYDRTADQHESLYNTFSLYLVNRADTGAGNFDIVFEYGDLNWDTDDSCGGLNGLVGPSSPAYPARAGYTNGHPSVGAAFFELPNSGTPGGIMALANSTKEYAIRTSSAGLVVRDTSVGGGQITDTSKGILGIAANASGGAVVSVGLTDLVGPQPDDYNYQILNGGNTVDSGHLYNDGTTTRVVLPRVGTYTVQLTRTADPSFVKRCTVAVAKIDVTWQGDDFTFPSEPAVHHNDDITASVTQVWAGQLIDLGTSLDGVGSILLQGWSLPGSVQDDYLKDYEISPDQMTGTVKHIGHSDTLSEELKLYSPVAGVRTFKVQVRAKIQDSVVIFYNSVTLNFRKPGVNLWVGHDAPPGYPFDPDNFQVKGTQGPAKMEGGTLTDGDVIWERYTPPIATAVGGALDYVQLISFDSFARGNGLHWHRGTDDQYCLDKGYPYPADGGDAPTVAAWYANYLSEYFFARDWLMWTPPGRGSITIPLQTWSWSFEAWANYADGSWTPHGFGDTDFKSDTTNVYPEWSNKYVA